MPNSRFADLDPFASKWDSDASIGAGSREIADIVGEQDEDEDDDLLDRIGFHMFDDEDLSAAEGEDLFTEVGRPRIGASATIKNKSGKAVYDHDKASKKITAITRSPATHAALGALATQAPHGTAAAAAAEVGIGYAEAWVALGGNVINTGNKVASVLKSPFRKKKKKNKKKGTPLESQSSEDLRAKLKSYRKWETSMPMGKMMYGPLANKIEQILKTRTDEREDIAAVDLEETNERARRGDKKARAKLIGLQFLTNPAMVRAQTLAKSLASGVPEQKARALASAQASIAAEQLARVIKRAKTKAQERGATRRKTPAKGMPDLAKTQRMIEDAASALEARVTKAARKRGPMQGILVPLKGGRKRGKFDNGDKGGTPGWVVTAKGRAIPGVWGTA